MSDRTWIILALGLVLSFAVTVFGGERPPSAPPIDERLTGIESRVSGHDTQIADLKKQVEALQLAIKCPCGRGGKCICPPGACLCPNCPEHGKKKSPKVVPSGLENQDDGIPFYGVSGVRVLFFTADWCGPCQAVKARLGDLIEQIEVVDCTDGNPCPEYNVTGYPTVIKLVDGKEKERCESPQIGKSIVSAWLAAPATGSESVEPIRDSRRETPTRIVHDGDASDDQIRQHLVDSHGYSWSQVSGMNRSQLKSAHDMAHGGPSKVSRNYPVRSAVQYQPRTYFRPSYGFCPNCR